jgi:hypothetical protein
VRLATQIDRRRELRFPQSLEMTVQALPELGSDRKLKIVPLRGRIQNISEGGVCLITSRPIERFSVLRCEFTIGDVPLKVATLMEVRWTRKQDLDPEVYLSGLEFLL